MERGALIQPNRLPCVERVASTSLGGRSHIAAGTLRNHRGTLAGWIADPQAIKPGARMPAALDIDGATLQALAAYLEQLK